MGYIGNDLIRKVAAVLASLGALNWGAVEFMNEDILVDTLNMSGDAYTAFIALVAIGGAVTAYNMGLVDLAGDPIDL